MTVVHSVHNMTGKKKAGRLHLVVLGLLSMVALALTMQTRPIADRLIPPIAGIVWQPHDHNLEPHGNWHQLGAYQLLVQWTEVDGRSFLPCTSSDPHCLTQPATTAPPVPPETPPPASAAGSDGADKFRSIPDWPRIGSEPWAQDVIMGLVGRFQESDARKDAVALAQASAVSAIAPPGVNVVGWYFPVEFDPTWDVAPSVIDALASLPRPLWVSVYDRTNLGPEQLVLHLQRWLPPDVGVFWQDGVGVHARDAKTSAQYIHAMIEHLGHSRVRVIAEAFRPDVAGGFRSANVAELTEQLAHYKGLSIYLFEGPTYITPELISELMSQPKVRTPSSRQGLAE